MRIFVHRIIDSSFWILRKTRKTSGIPCTLNIIALTENGNPTIISISTLFAVGNMNILRGTNVLHGTHLSRDNSAYNI